MIYDLKKGFGRIKYSLYLFYWIFLFHLPVILFLPQYFEVLLWRTNNWGGISYGVLFGLIGELLRLDYLVTFIWLSSLLITTGLLLFEKKLNILEKFVIILMVNNLTEFQGGIGHIAIVLPFMAIYFLIETPDKKEKTFFCFFCILSIIWAFDRIIFNIREISDYFGVIYISIMIIITTWLFLIYLKGLKRAGKFETLINIAIKN